MPKYKKIIRKECHTVINDHKCPFRRKGLKHHRDLTEATINSTFRPQAATLDAAEDSFAELRKRLPATLGVPEGREVLANGVVLTAMLQILFLKGIHLWCAHHGKLSLFCLAGGLFVESSFFLRDTALAVAIVGTWKILSRWPILAWVMYASFEFIAYLVKIH